MSAVVLRLSARANVQEGGLHRSTVSASPPRRDHVRLAEPPRVLRSVMCVELLLSAIDSLAHPSLPPETCPLVIGRDDDDMSISRRRRLNDCGIPTPPRVLACAIVTPDDDERHLATTTRPCDYRIPALHRVVTCSMAISDDDERRISRRRHEQMTIGYPHRRVRSHVRWSFPTTTRGASHDDDTSR